MNDLDILLYNQILILRALAAVVEDRDGCRAALAETLRAAAAAAVARQQGRQRPVPAGGV